MSDWSNAPSRAPRLSPDQVAEKRLEAFNQHRAARGLGALTEYEFEVRGVAEADYRDSTDPEQRTRAMDVIRRQDRRMDEEPTCSPERAAMHRAEIAGLLSKWAKRDDSAPIRDVSPDS